VLAGFVKGAQDVLHEQGYTVLLACSDENPERELSFLSAVGSGKVDGLIMATSSEQNERLTRARSEVSVPAVLFDREMPGGLDSVLIAHDQGVNEALEHLRSLGHQRIALLTGGQDVYPSRARIQGYKNFYLSRGLSWEERLICANNFSEEWAFRESSVLLSGARPPSAIIVGGISMLPGAIRAIRACKLTIPNDISLVGYGDSDLARFCKPSISVVTSDYTEIGRTCAELLLERMRDQHLEEIRRIIVPAEYVMRGSCAAAPRDA
jgi:LacI family transcriptional regulator